MEEIAPRYTRHQVPRGTRADAETPREYYLLKAASVLHATYQIRLLAYRAWKERKTLVIRVPAQFRKGPSLARLMRDHPKLIRIEKRAA